MKKYNVVSAAFATYSLSELQSNVIALLEESIVFWKWGWYHDTPSNVYFGGVLVV